MVAGGTDTCPQIAGLSLVVVRSLDRTTNPTAGLKKPRWSIGVETGDLRSGE